MLLLAETGLLLLAETGLLLLAETGCAAADGDSVFRLVVCVAT